MALSDLIMGLINHQSQSEKAALTKQEIEAQGEEQRRNMMYGATQSSPAGIGTNSAMIDSLVKNVIAQHPELDPTIVRGMFSSDGTSSAPAIRETLETSAGNKAGVYQSSAKTQLAKNEAAQKEASETAQRYGSMVSPEIANSLATTNTNVAKHTATTSSFLNDPTNLSLENKNYTTGIRSQLAGANRSIFDSSHEYTPGSMMGFNIDPITGATDLAHNPTPSLQQSMLTGGRVQQATGKPVFVNGQLVGNLPHYFTPTGEDTIGITAPPEQPIAPAPIAPQIPVNQPTPYSRGGILGATANAIGSPSVYNAIYDATAPINAFVPGTAANRNITDPAAWSNAYDITKRALVGPSGMFADAPSQADISIAKLNMVKSKAVKGYPLTTAEQELLRNNQ